MIIIPAKVRAQSEHRHYFAISFIATFCVMAFMAFMAVYVFSPNANPSGAEAANADAYVPVAEDSLTVLVVGQPGDKEGVPIFVLAKFDPTRQTISVTALPAQTYLVKGEKKDTLGGTFWLGGGAYARLALAEAMGLQIDRYMVIQQAEFLQIMELLGPTDYQLPVALQYESEERFIDMDAGLYQLDGKKAYDVITYPTYGGGEIERCQIVTGLVTRVINGRMELFTSPLVDAIFSGVVNRAETDLSQLDYQQRKTAAEYMAHLATEPAVAADIAGAFDEAGEHFILSEEGTATLTQLYGQPN